MARILIIDDDPLICRTLEQLFARTGHVVQQALELKEGFEKIMATSFDIIFLDVNLPDGNGLDAIPAIKRQPSAPEVIIMTGAEEPEGAELAMESKAWDYIQKSRSPKEFKFSLARALEYRQQKQAGAQRRPIKRDGIIGESQGILKCLERVAGAAANDLPILITGETGTGKELFSRAIHENSPQSGSEFIVVDCTALPEHLVESTLFGHTKGAFTGADSDKPGLMKMADNGTLFLDEVGELPLDIQKKFLRALQEKKFRPVGGRKEISSDFRLICATHRDLKHLVEKGKFREDLFFRLFSKTIHLPPLRERKKDISAIAQNCLKGRNLKSRIWMDFDNAPTISAELLEELQLYDWPGNVRELINTVQLIGSEAGTGSTLFPHHLPGHIRAANIRKKFKLSNGIRLTEGPSQDVMASGNLPSFKSHIERAKYDYLNRLLATSNSSIKTACDISGLSRSQLYRLMKQYQISGP